MSEQKTLCRDRPVSDFDIEFVWQTNHWLSIFDKQVELIKQDVARAKAEDKSVIYLSCPISSRGGGYSKTNVAIADFTARRLLRELGDRIWILNPAKYQLESNEGTGLLYQHMRNLKLKTEDINKLPAPKGGDYMRMWTKILVEDGDRNIGEHFDAYYFLGPKDTTDFFKQTGANTTTAAVETYFAQQMANDTEFQEHFQSEDRRSDFFKFYALKASSFFSLGCRDEWNIWVRLNKKRLVLSSLNEYHDGDVGELLAGYYDAAPITADVRETTRGYAIS